MKINNKGFMMAEVVVVSAIILVFLTSLYVSYNKIYSAYIKRIEYNDTTTLYRLGFYHDYLVKNEKFNDLLVSARSNNIAFMYISESNDTKYDEKAFVICNNYKNLSSNVLDSQNIHPTYKDYIKYLSSSVNLTNNEFVLVMERCLKENADYCRYAYLEVPNET